ncbi:bifunctional oligoribonuclease/PAP phosphatase NrnA [candidate division KSB1 bacterium]|nr:bifunctional oligoribonuclease/PAP phosphatase NrnA [candidate division KSB1 bacterium]
MMIEPHQWDQIQSIFDAHESFLISTHLNPDGDALGAEIALAEYLRCFNKKTYIVNISPTMANYSFLDPDEEIIIFDETKHMHLLTDVDVFIFVDISDWERMGSLGDHIRRLESPKICIDHHHMTTKFSDIDIILEAASSTGELIYDFLHHVNFKITGKIATAIYTCLLTDTGSFRFSNTTARTHEIAAELIHNGVNSRAIYEYVYESNSPEKIILMGLALSTLKFECDNRVAWFCLTQKMFAQSGAQLWDTEGFPEIPRTIKDVEVSIMFTELEENRTKISLRSKGRIIINAFASSLGGGGHNYAAGAMVQQSLDETIPWVLNQIKQLMSAEDISHGISAHRRGATIKDDTLINFD